jgi:hypothetical protein
MDVEHTVERVIDDDEECAVCLQTWAWHKAAQPAHKFARAGEGLETRSSDLPTEAEARPQAPPAEIHIAGDPVLRLALVKKGLLTEMQLDEAEMWLREATRRGKALVVHDGEYRLEDF